MATEAPTVTKISKATLEILKNFAGIQQNLVVRAGNKISTISSGKNIIATAEVSETFDKTFGIYDLNVLLGSMSTFTAPEFEVDDSKITLREGTREADVYLSDVTNLTAPNPDKPVKLPKVALSFDLTAGDLEFLQRQAAVSQAPHLIVESKNDRIVVQVKDKKNPTSNGARIELGDAQGHDFRMIVEMSNLRLLPGDYTVDLFEQLATRWTHKTRPVVYIVAQESDSRFKA